MRYVNKGKPSKEQDNLFQSLPEQRAPLKIPPIKTDWVPPTSLPDLTQETEVSIDIETRDDLLAKDKGPGFYQYEKTNPNTGYICGISAAWRDQSIYIPVRHRETNCFGFSAVQNWLYYLASQNHIRFIFHNFSYDWGWIETVFDIPPPHLLDDTMAMASMVNENLSSYSLDNLCKWQGLPGKDETLLNQALGKKGKGSLWELPGNLVGPYAEQDAVSTLKLSQKLRPLLTAENLNDAYQVERNLMPITLKMKQRGIRVDIERTNHLADQIFKQCEKELQELSVHPDIRKKVEIKDLRRSAWLKEEFDRQRIVPKYPMTAKTILHEYGQASFEKEFMANHPHWFPRMCQKIKSRYDLADKFLTKFILGYNHKGRVYPSVNQFRSETGGARSHRFSYADPPLQQMPSRDEEYASLIRSCFIPEDGEEWGSIDYRQQEYRLIVHHAELKECKGAKRAADMYRTDPDTDFHDYVAAITRLPRERAKDVNFATSYGAGVSKFARMTGMDEVEAREVMEIYYKELPFVREVSNWYSRFASEHGYIEMLDGARNHFNLWEPVYRDFAKENSYKRENSGLNILPCDEQEMNRRRKDKDHPWYGERMKRAYTHKAFNRIIQGSAARQIKKAMVDVYNTGYMPILQIHDELAFSLSDPNHAKVCAEIMEHAIPSITIPMLTDIKLGKSWGDLKK
jgi:DNA polymerase I-like protein with 3'-5' exonuclease and polymerase domains